MFRLSLFNMFMLVSIACLAVPEGNWIFDERVGYDPVEESDDDENVVRMPWHETIYNEDVLPYLIPEPPDHFVEMPEIELVDYEDFDDGTSFYRSWHQYGWELCRKKFQRGKDSIDPEDAAPWHQIQVKWNQSKVDNPNRFDPTHPNFDYKLNAKFDGWLACKEQLNELMDNNMTSTLREMLVSPSYSRRLRRAIMLGLGLIFLVSLFIPRRSTTPELASVAEGKEETDEQQV